MHKLKIKQSDVALFEQVINENKIMHTSTVCDGGDKEFTLDCTGNAMYWLGKLVCRKEVYNEKLNEILNS